MNEMKSISLAVEDAITEQLDQLEKRDKYHQRKIKEQRKIIEGLRRQIKEFTAYVHGGKQQIDMIKLAQVVGEFDRETHLIEIIKLVPSIRQDLCENLQYLLPWAHPGWSEEITEFNAEKYAQACIVLEGKIMEAGKEIIDGSSSKKGS